MPYQKFLLFDTIVQSYDYSALTSPARAKRFCRVFISILGECLKTLLGLQLLFHMIGEDGYLPIRLVSANEGSIAHFCVLFARGAHRDGHYSVDKL